MGSRIRAPCFAGLLNPPCSSRPLNCRRGEQVWFSCCPESALRIDTGERSISVPVPFSGLTFRAGEKANALVNLLGVHQSEEGNHHAESTCAPVARIGPDRDCRAAFSAASNH